MKQTILSSLKQGGPVSGEALAEELGVSRTAVWKCVKQLRREGYRIDSSPRRGYVLKSVSTRLLAEEVGEGLTTRLLGRSIISCEKMSSTQDHAKILALQGSPEGTVVVAETQTGGRGRLGRSWNSPPGGLYFSVILRPRLSLVEAAGMSLVAGIALVLAIERSVPCVPRLKWPNDVLVNGRKAAGVLAEMSAELDRLDWVVLGIGVNVNTSPSRFTPDIRETATSLKVESGRAVGRLKLFQHILCELEKALDEFLVQGFEPFRRRWIEISDTLERKVVVNGGREPLAGRAVDIDNEGALILEFDDKTRRRVISGDVSLQGIIDG